MNRQSVSNSRKRATRGFTLIEVLVTIVLVSVGLVAVMQGIRSLNAADAKASRADLLQKLALQKLGELRATEDPNTMDTKGDFTEEGYPNIAWTLDTQPSGADNVNQLTLTVTQDNDAQTLTELVYVPPQTGTTGTPTTGRTGQ